MTTTTLFPDTESRLKNSTNFSRNNTRPRKKKPMINSRECSKPRRNLTSWTELLSKLRSIMRSWSLKLLLRGELHTVLKSQWWTLKSKRRARMCLLIPWMRRSRGWMSRKLSIKPNWFHRKKKLPLLETLLRKLLSKLRRSSCQRRPFLMTGKNLFLVCNREIKLFRPLRSSSSRSKTISFRLSLRYLVFVMRPRKSKKSPRILLNNSIKWRKMKNSYKSVWKKLRTNLTDSTNNS